MCTMFLHREIFRCQERLPSTSSPSTFLGGEEFDPNTMRIIGVAFEMARASVKRDWGGIYASHIIAKRIIELAKGGERNPDVLCEQALSYFLRP